MNLIKNEILNKQDIELKENARIAAIKKLEKIISEWDCKRLGYAGLRRHCLRLAELNGHFTNKLDQ